MANVHCTGLLEDWKEGTWPPSSHDQHLNCLFNERFTILCAFYVHLGVFPHVSVFTCIYMYKQRTVTVLTRIH